MIHSIAVAGAGTMGSGIALAAAQSGFNAILFDLNPGALDNAKKGIEKNLSKAIEKKIYDAATAAEISARITYTGKAEGCKADLVIEAIIEDLEIKASLLNQLAAINHPPTIIASNTSSLSISDLQEKIPNPERVAGMHFFNPAHIMKLVEIVKGKCTSAETINALEQVCRRMKKTPVVCIDSPGFIVNRVARPFYLEAMKQVEDGWASPEDIDKALTAAGFKMGPFKLMDLIGLDINFAVSESVYAALGKPERFQPSNLQKSKVEAGELGRKTGKGFYQY
ncbi:MAG: 3-hydroxyacyl-CoA dehydrogenase NAD-binding domain-containing protein [Ferruginibacter sp.]